MTFMPLRKKLKSRRQKNCPCRLCKTYVPYFGFQNLSYDRSFLRENALTWFSSSAFTANFLSAFSVGIFHLILYIFFLIYFLFMYVYVDFKTFISIVFKCYRLNLGYRKPPRCVGAISQI